MASTIKLKNGSGAPLASDLVQGEPALDLTNKRLYTEDSGGNVIEVGTNPSTITIPGGTIDGTTIGGTTPAAGTFTTFTSTGIDDNASATAVTIDSSGNVGIGTSPDTNLDVRDTAANNGGTLTLGTTTSSTGENYGQIQFYKADGSGGGSGVTASIVAADASSVGSGSNLIFSTGGQTLGSNNIERMCIDYSGNVGIGTTSPSLPLDVVGTIRTSGQLQHNERIVPTSTSGDGSASAPSICPGFDYDTGFFRPTTNTIGFSTGGSERMRIDSSGNLLVGQSSSTTVDTLTSGSGYSFQSNGRAAIARTNGICLAANRIGTDGDIIEFKKDGTQVGRIGHDTYGIEIDGKTGYLGLNVNDALDANTGVEILSRGFTATPRMQPNGDNKLNLGDSGRRWKTVYAVTTTINNSDINEKQDIEELSEAELRVAVACKGLMRKYRWKDAVEEKGDDARIHFGIIAQDLQAAFEAEGLDAHRYAVFCSDTWWEHEVEVPAVEGKEAVLDEEGNVIEEAVEAQEAYIRTDIYDTAEEAPEGAVERTRLGVRYSELLAFIIAAI